MTKFRDCIQQLASLHAEAIQTRLRRFPERFKDIGTPFILTVYDDHLVFEFKSGLEIEVKI